MILVNSKGWLIHNKKHYKCALGKKGITKNISENVLYQYRRFYVRENKSNC